MVSVLAWVDWGASWMALVLAVVLIKLDRLGRVNRIFALIWAAYIIPTAASGFLLLAGDDPSRWFLYRVAVTGYTIILNVANPLAMPFFLRFPLRWLIPIGAVAVPLCAWEVWQIWTGPGLITGFVPTAWGTAAVMNPDTPLVWVDLAANAFASLLMLSSLIVRSIRSPSPRLRSLARRFLAALIGLAVLQGVASAVIGTQVVVDVTPAIVLLLTFFHSFVLLRFHLWGLESKNLETFLFQSTRDGVFLLDENLKILDANTATRRTVGVDPEGTRGQDWPSLFDNPDELRAIVVETGRGHVDNVPTQREGMALYASFHWNLDSLGNRMGAVASVRKQDSLVEILESHALTSREQDVVFHLIQGAGNKEIGEQLFISAGTVKNHLVNIYKKMGAANRVELFRLLLGNQAPRARGGDEA